MPAPLLCYITDRRQFPGYEPMRRRLLLKKIADAAQCGMNYIQLREKDLSVRELESLAREAVQIVRSSRPQAGRALVHTAVLINSRTDVALATDADGVHLRADGIAASEARQIWEKCKGGNAPMQLGVSCHSILEVELAERQGADFVVFAPVFEKQSAPDAQPAGLDALREACRRQIPVLALGGVTLENTAACLEAGAAGIAAIRLFQENDIAEVVRRLRTG